MAAKGWIQGDESAGDMLSRVLTQQFPFLLLPPLHRLPLRVGNVVELVGPSNSAKTQILMQVAISCILPKEWNGIHYGGLGRLVMFLDLDCRFDVLRLSQMLQHRIMKANGLSNEVHWEEKKGDWWNCHAKRQNSLSCDEELFAVCMRRFLYVRCYDSFEFLTTLKTLHCRLQEESEAHGISFYFLMIDSLCYSNSEGTNAARGKVLSLTPCFLCLVHVGVGTYEGLLLKPRNPHHAKMKRLLFENQVGYCCIGAFHCIDRACRPLPTGFNNRKSLSLQCVSETVVREIRNLLLVHPMVVIATKAIITVDKNSVNEIKWKVGKWSAPDTSYSDNVKTNSELFQHHEYMPSVWQTFVTHRIAIRPTGEYCAVSGDDREHSVYLSEWLLPRLKYLDKFAVGDAGIGIVP